MNIICQLSVNSSRREESELSVRWRHTWWHPAEKMSALSCSADHSPDLTVLYLGNVLCPLHFWTLVGSITVAYFLSRKVSSAEIQMFWVGLLWLKIHNFINSFMNSDNLRLQTGKAGDLCSWLFFVWNTLAANCASASSLKYL